jgi:hypothetical protein
VNPNQTQRHQQLNTKSVTCGDEDVMGLQSHPANTKSQHHHQTKNKGNRMTSTWPGEGDTHGPVGAHGNAAPQGGNRKAKARKARKVRRNLARKARTTSSAMTKRFLAMQLSSHSKPLCPRILLLNKLNLPSNELSASENHRLRKDPGNICLRPTRVSISRISRLQSRHDNVE